MLGVYNYHRDYDPQMGQYVESDPIDLGGGINTYGYVDSNPLIYSDRMGLDRWGDDPSLRAVSETPERTKELICWYQKNYPQDPWYYAQRDRGSSASDPNTRNAEHFFYARDYLRPDIGKAGSIIASQLWSMGKLVRNKDPFQIWPTSSPSMQEHVWGVIGSTADAKKDFCECQK